MLILSGDFSHSSWYNLHMFHRLICVPYYIPIISKKTYYSGWWFQPTPLKNDGVNVSWDHDPIWKVIKFHGSSHHQPVTVGLYHHSWSNALHAYYPLVIFLVAYWKFTNVNRLIIINIFFDGPSIYYRYDR